MMKNYLSEDCRKVLVGEQSEKELEEDLSNWNKVITKLKRVMFIMTNGWLVELEEGKS